MLTSGIIEGRIMTGLSNRIDDRQSSSNRNIEYIPGIRGRPTRLSRLTNASILKQCRKRKPSEAKHPHRFQHAKNTEIKYSGGPLYTNIHSHVGQYIIKSGDMLTSELSYFMMVISICGNFTESVPLSLDASHSLTATDALSGDSLINDPL